MNLRPQRPQSSAIDLTPMIDVVFLLLIFFMVSTTFEQDIRIRVQLPQAQGEKSAPPDEPRALEITIDAEGFFYVAERRLLDRKPATLQKAIVEVVGDSGVATGDTRRGPVEERELPVIIRADAGTPHQAVMTAMDAASRLGLLRFALAATRPAAADE